MLLFIITNLLSSFLPIWAHHSLAARITCGE